MSQAQNSARPSLTGNLQLLDTQSSAAFQTVRGTRQNLFNNTTMSKVGKSLASTIRSDAGHAFSRANDRFYAPTMKK